MLGSGLIEHGAHTHTHADFRGRPDDMLADLATNLAVLRDNLASISRPLRFLTGPSAMALPAVSWRARRGQPVSVQPDDGSDDRAPSRQPVRLGPHSGGRA